MIGDQTADPLTHHGVLIVVAGRPGTGKTTLCRGLVAHLAATYLRIDAVETALMSSSGQTSVGVEGYLVAHALARSNLELGRDTVIDAVCPVPESRTGWADTATATRAQLIMFETALADEHEHRRRVKQRTPDMPGQRVPTWTDVADGEWTPWDPVRDGERTIIDTTVSESALTRAIAELAARSR